MKHNQQFDEHIQEQFSNYSPNVPPHIWEKIMADEYKKRPLGFWVSMFSNRNKLLLIGLIIALSSGGAWVYLNNDFSKNDNQTATENKNNNSDKNNSTNFISATPLSIQQADLTSNGPDKEEPVVTAGHDANKNTSWISAAKTKAQILTGYPLINEENVMEKTSSSTGTGTKKKRFTGLGNILVNITAPEYTEEGEAFEGQGTLLGRLTFTAEKYTAKRKRGKPETLSFNPVIFLPDCPSLEKDAAGNKKYFEFYAGPDYAIRSLHDTGNSAYLQQRKESTKFKSGFSAGVRYTRVFNNSMSVRGGVNYSQINEKFTFNQGNIVQVTYIINNNGDTIGSYSTTGTRYKTTINRYRSVDIPLVIGYEVGNGKLHANINAGAIVNIYSWQKGDILDMSGNPVNITTGKGSSAYQFKTNAGVGFIGAVTIYYKLNDKLHLMAEPYFRYNFSQMNKALITLKQKYQTAGLRFGIRIDLK